MRSRNFIVASQRDESSAEGKYAVMLARLEVAADQRDATLIAACLHVAGIAEATPGPNGAFTPDVSAVDEYARRLYLLVTARPWERGDA